MARGSGTMATATFSELVAEASAGGDAAWRELCGRLRNVVWRTINSFGVHGADADDAYAATMFRLAEQLGRIRDPERLPGWAATTARHEALGLFRTRKRMAAHAELRQDPPATDETDRLVRQELNEAVRLAFARIDKRCQQLLRVLTADPPLPYEDVGDLLDMPHGSIGPTRRRCLDNMRMQDPLRAYLTELP